MDVKQALILLEKYFNNKKSQGELSLNGLDLFEVKHSRLFNNT